MRCNSPLVMPALGAGIHVLRPYALQDVDGRDKPGHDSWESEGRPKIRIYERYQRLPRGGCHQQA
jgi:hypothetical protein